MSSTSQIYHFLLLVVLSPVKGVYRVSNDVDLVEHHGLRELPESVELVELDSDHAILIRLKRPLKTHTHTKLTKEKNDANM